MAKQSPNLDDELRIFLISVVDLKKGKQNKRTKHRILPASLPTPVPITHNTTQTERMQNPVKKRTVNLGTRNEEQMRCCHPFCSSDPTNVSNTCFATNSYLKMKKQNSPNGYHSSTDTSKKTNA
jgi:hypothetical protein